MDDGLGISLNFCGTPLGRSCKLKLNGSLLFCGLISNKETCPQLKLLSKSLNNDEPLSLLASRYRAGRGWVRQIQILSGPNKTRSNPGLNRKQSINFWNSNQPSTHTRCMFIKLEFRVSLVTSSRLPWLLYIVFCYFLILNKKKGSISYTSITFKRSFTLIFFFALFLHSPPLPIHNRETRIVMKRAKAT